MTLLSATSIGFMANMLLPARAGEVVRAYIIGQKERLGTMASLATIVVERVADLMSILLVMIPMLIFASMQPNMWAVAGSLRVGGYLATLLSVALIGSLWLLKSRTSQTVQRIG